MLLGGIGFVLIFTLALLLGILCAWFEDQSAGSDPVSSRDGHKLYSGVLAVPSAHSDLCR